MQREILFKAKRKDNGEWVFGYYMQDGLGNHYIIEIKKKEDKVYYSGKTYRYIEVIPETICEYICQPDKNGVKIFENDIVRFTANRWNGVMEYPIVFNVKQAKFVIDAKFKKFGIVNGNVEVIGNIFDNEGVRI